MAESVKVAVRVRPFNSRETQRNAKLIIGMNGNTTIIKDPANAGDEGRKFAFDFSYWSHDEFTEGADGYLSPNGAKYADQKVVFEDLGRGVLANAWKGYNVSLFAYGQTGSGKSYSMVGYGANKGIVPVSSETLFTEIEAKRENAAKGEEYQVTFSMLEIYNEQVRDLLNPKSNVKGGLKVREKPGKGFYVEQLTAAAVNSYAEIEAKEQEGTRNRTVAATAMNATSSRAHTIVAINFTQKAPNEAGESMTKQATINLVDLAGSERAESTGATGDRLKEGSAINKSLSALGNVIKALADQSTGKANVMVPFRDSTLTRLLKNALGGNSKTIMIAALSPADINYEETLSTLRFADRAKAIKTTATVNESPTDKLIRELKEENAKLMEMLKKGGVPPEMLAAQADGGGGGGDSQEEVEEMRKQMEAEMKKNQEEMEAMKLSWEERMKEQNNANAQKLAEDAKKAEQVKVTPHFWNLNEDPSLTGMVNHLCLEGTTAIGTDKAKKAPGILLKGLNIQPEHASVTNKGGVVKIKCVGNSRVVINGQSVSKEQQLHHNDRVLFGNSHLYVFHSPQDYAKAQKDGKKIDTPSFEQAQEEIAENSGMAALLGGAGGKSKEDLLLQEDLIHMLPMVNEANAMSEELDKKVKFEVALIAPQARGLKEGRTEVNVKHKNLQTGTVFMWDRNKFIDRKFMMQEVYQNYVEGDKNWNDGAGTDADPFWVDPAGPVLIGTSQIIIKSLGYLIETQEKLPITDFKGNDEGYLQVEINPCNAKGGEIDDNDFVEDPKELVGKSLNFKILIPHARGLNAKYDKTYASYRFYLDEDACKTEMVGGSNPEYKHEKMFSYKVVTDSMVEYIMNGQLSIEVWGSQKEVAQAKPATGKAGDKKAPAGKSTKELMAAEKAKDNTKEKEAAKRADAAEYKLKTAEEKLRKIQALCSNAVENKVEADKVMSIIGSAGGASGGAAGKARADNMGSEGSRACSIM